MNLEIWFQVRYDLSGRTILKFPYCATWTEIWLHFMIEKISWKRLFSFLGIKISWNHWFLRFIIRLGNISWKASFLKEFIIWFVKAILSSFFFSFKSHFWEKFLEVILVVLNASFFSYFVDYVVFIFENHT